MESGELDCYSRFFIFSFLFFGAAFILVQFCGKICIFIYIRKERDRKGRWSTQLKCVLSNDDQ